MSILIKNIKGLMPDEKEIFVLKDISLVIEGDTISKIVYDKVDNESALGSFDKIIDGAILLIFFIY